MVFGPHKRGKWTSLFYVYHPPGQKKKHLEAAQVHLVRQLETNVRETSEILIDILLLAASRGEGVLNHGVVHIKTCCKCLNLLSVPQGMRRLKTSATESLGINETIKKKKVQLNLFKNLNLLIHPLIFGS